MGLLLTARPACLFPSGFCRPYRDVRTGQRISWISGISLRSSNKSKSMASREAEHDVSHLTKRRSQAFNCPEMTMATCYRPTPFRSCRSDGRGGNFYLSMRKDQYVTRRRRCVALLSGRVIVSASSEMTTVTPPAIVCLPRLEFAATIDRWFPIMNADMRICLFVRSRGGSNVILECPVHVDDMPWCHMVSHGKDVVVSAPLEVFRHGICQELGVPMGGRPRVQPVMFSAVK
ncbi:hypothetical protein BC835DRAFT_864036 [Cytidiella melzeri]|nr:hypothetical protein BC835DRAFT_864036 [Cytidiella melzeri]